MAFDSFLRRASRSIIPQAIRLVTTHRAIISEVNNVENRCLVGGQFLPFITRFSTFTNNNLSSLLESDNYRSEPGPDVLSTRDGSPFIVEYSSRCTLLKSKYQNEEIFAEVGYPDIHSVVGPIIPMSVTVSRGEQDMYFDVYVKPERVRIQSLVIRDNDAAGHLENFKEYMKSKGINSGMINMLCDRLGVKRKINTTANPL